MEVDQYYMKAVEDADKLRLSRDAMISALSEIAELKAMTNAAHNVQALWRAIKIAKATLDLYG